MADFAFSVKPEDFPGNENRVVAIIAALQEIYEDTALMCVMRFSRGVLQRQGNILTREQVDAYLLKGK